VEKRLEKTLPVVSGCIQYRCAREGSTCMGTRFDHLSILSSARPRPMGLPVIPTPVWSASCSREREMAS
jgi:hypothetical protein